MMEWLITEYSKEKSADIMLLTRLIVFANLTGDNPLSALSQGKRESI